MGKSATFITHMKERSGGEARRASARTQMMAFAERTRAIESPHRQIRMHGARAYPASNLSSRLSASPFDPSNLAILAGSHIFVEKYYCRVQIEGWLGIDRQSPDSGGSLVDSCHI